MNGSHNSATLAIIVATRPLPHGELVEPRTTSMQQSIFKKITPTYPTPSHLAYSDGVLSGGNAPENFRSQERIGDFICGENPTAGERFYLTRIKSVIETGDPGVFLVETGKSLGNACTALPIKTPAFPFGSPVFPTFQ
ncbi:hypothetical protein AB4Y96_11560 [Phyllobacterium sp. TAF24]|uniref:hypothetical protein n=1 Tax=Phyllobacterium sp. TAF24 TaxID=3233068 RepID=UPI003F9BC1BA